jgi:hypothetical protein
LIAGVATRRVLLMIYVYGWRFALSSGLATHGRCRARVNRVVKVQTNVGSCNDVIAPVSYRGDALVSRKVSATGRCHEGRCAVLVGIAIFLRKEGRRWQSKEDCTSGLQQTTISKPCAPMLGTLIPCRYPLAMYEVVNDCNTSTSDHT